MKTVLLGGTVVNVFCATLEKENVLIEDEKIIGIGDYSKEDADVAIDVSGKFICPGLIDGHMHIESTMLTPPELARVCLPHGTTAIVADPHEICNVCGTAGIAYILEMSKEIPLGVYVMLPSCVPATSFDESGATLTAEDLEPLYMNPRVLGLAEMMNYPGVIAKDPSVLQKIEDAKANGKVVDGHAPLLSGHDLDKYIACGIRTDHECSNTDEAIEKIKKGQWLMIRQGTAARNLEGLLPLFDEPYCHRCLLVTDDREPSDLIREGHIDNIIRRAVKAGKNPITAIQMATLHAATCFGIKDIGAIAPGYKADLLVLDNLEDMKVRDVFVGGERIVENGEVVSAIPIPPVRGQIQKQVRNSFFLDALEPSDFYLEAKSNRCHVIDVVKDQLLTKDTVLEIDWNRQNGIDIERDILKIAVIERHLNTGHRGVGFIRGIKLQRGAIAASVSHDSHNLIVIGTNEEDMAFAANRVREMSGGSAVVEGGKVLAELPLPIAGLMSTKTAKEIACLNEKRREALYECLGVPRGTEPFMTMAFVSLPVIPELKMSTQGLIDVNKQERISLYA